MFVPECCCRSGGKPNLVSGSPRSQCRQQSGGRFRPGGRKTDYVTSRSESMRWWGKGTSCSLCTTLIGLGRVVGERVASSDRDSGSRTTGRLIYPLELVSMNVEIACNVWCCTSRWENVIFLLSTALGAVEPAISYFHGLRLSCRSFRHRGPRVKGRERAPEFVMLLPVSPILPA